MPLFSIFRSGQMPPFCGLMPLSCIKPQKNMVASDAITPKRCRHLWTNATLFILFSRTYATLSRTYATLSRTYATLLNLSFSRGVETSPQTSQKKTWWLPMPLLLFVVRGIEPPPSAATLPTHSSYLVRPSSLFSLSLLSLILQAAVKAVSHFFTSSPRLPTVGQLFFLSLIIHQQYFTTCSL